MSERRASPTELPRRVVTPSTAVREPDLPVRGILPSGTLAVGIGIVVALGFVWTMLEGNYNQFGGLLVALFLFVATVPVARHAARVENWPGLSSLLMVGMVLRLVGAVARYLVAYGLYGGVADASTYTSVAQQNYHAFRHLHVFVPKASVYHNIVPWVGTVVYALAGPTEIGSFFVFAWFNFLGCYLFYRAFRIAFPEGDGRRYAYMIMLLPGLLYWPSSLGKEGWMMLVLGLATYGVARVLAGRLGGYTALLAGIGGTLLVRPHLALIFLPAALLALVLRRAAPGKRRPMARVVGIVVIVLASLVVVGKVQSYFGIKNLDVQSVTKELKTTRTQTAEGNSAFNPPNAQSPLGYPEAVVTVMFRPFPWEAKSKTVLVASGEGLLLMGLVAASWRRLRRLPHFLVRSPYVMFCFIYSALFILAFSNFANFGILARERVQMWPMVLALLALPMAAPSPAMAQSDAGAIEDVSPRLTRARRGARRPKRAVAQPTVAARFVAGPYRALGCTFDVEVAAGPFRRIVRRTLGDLSSSGPATEHYQVAAVPDSKGLLAIPLRDGQPVGQPSPISEALVQLVTDVNFRAVASRPDKLVLHAGAVSSGDGGLLFPGPSGAGKSTLTAALVARGFGYLSDEAAALDPDSLEIEPYPKPMSLDVSSLGLLGHRTGGEPGESKQVVAASLLRPRSVGRPVRPRFLVFPSYQPGAVSALSEMHRAEAMVEVASCSFNFLDHGGEWMPLLRRLVAECWCGRLTIGDLDEAAELVSGLVEVQGGAQTR